VKTVTKF